MKLPKSSLAAHLSIRIKPKNLKKEDLHLFVNAQQQEIGQIQLLELESVSILKEVIFSWKTLKYYNSLSNIHPLSTSKVIKNLTRLLFPQKEVISGIWITDNWSSEYFHWFTDALPRLLVVESFLKTDQLLLPENYKAKPYVRESLELLKVKVHYYNPKKSLFVKHLNTATHTAPTGNYNKQVINHLRDRFLTTKISDEPTRKIFISRQKANKRKISNEAEVIGLISAFGYETHFFEDYDLKKQIEIMTQTKSVVALHGAGLTNMLFMPEGAQVLELRNENDDHNNCFFSLASALGHEYYYLLNNGNTMDTNLVEVHVDLEKLQETITLMETAV